MFTQETWKFINTFAPWFSAIGTISAVVLSLHFARRDKRIRLNIRAGHRLIITPGVPAPHPEYLVVKIVNIGHREAQITNIGWTVGFIKKRYAVQSTINNMLSSEFPIRLKDGEEASYYFPLAEDEWLNNFINTMLKPFPRLLCHFLNIEAYTSIGNSFSSRIEKGFKKKIIEKLK